MKIKFYADGSVKFFEDGVEVPYPTFDEVVVEIDAWYDRHTRDYCIQCLNKEGYQVGDAVRVGDKWSKDKVVADLRKEHGLA